MNLAEGRQAVIDRGFDYLDPSRLTMMLNTAKDTFEDMWEWPWLQTTLIGPTPISFDDLKLILTVKVAGTHNELLSLDVRQVNIGFSDLTTPGTPEYWWVEGADVMHAYPGDGAVLEVRYIRESLTLAVPEDVPLIPRRYHSLWIDLAVCEAYKDSDNFAAAQALRADVGLRMVDVIARYETRNRQHSPFMTVRSFSEDD